MNLDRLRVLALIVPALLAISLFSAMHMLGLICLVLGSIMIFLGRVAEYRLISVFGLLVVTGIATSTIALDTLGSVQSVITASVGLVVPLFVLVWVSLSPEPDVPPVPPPSRRSALMAAVYVLACIVSVPVAAVILGIAFPSLSLLFTGLVEVSIISVVAVVGAILAVSVEPKSGAPVE